MFRKYAWFAIPFALASVVLYTGCNASNSNPPQAAGPDKGKDSKAAEVKKDDEHAHKPGAHGGIIVEIGRDNYHAEAVFEKGGTLRLNTLGKDEARVQEVEAQTVAAYVKPEGGTEASSILLKPAPQPGDKPGMTSQFVGQLPAEMVGKAVEVTIPSMTIAGERFRLGFKSASEAHADSGMPPGASGEEAKDLYLKPGGIYTEADIKANGNMTAAQKFKGIVSNHNAKPKPGQKICPISMTQANPKFTWIVGGKPYEFCCPPCVDEFVKTAKNNPEEILPPEKYVKQQQ
jgi:hypothetical protein